MPAPGQRLVADAQATLGSNVTQFAKIGGSAVDAAESKRRDVGTDQHQVGAKFLHHIEFALGALEGARALWLRKALEIAKRLKQRDGQAVIAHHAADFGRRAVESKEIVLEDLDAIKARCRDRGKLLAKVAAD